MIVPSKSVKKMILGLALRVSGKGMVKEGTRNTYKKERAVDHLNICESMGGSKRDTKGNTGIKANYLKVYQFMFSAKANSPLRLFGGTCIKNDEACAPIPLR